MGYHIDDIKPGDLVQFTRDIVSVEGHRIPPLTHFLVIDVFILRGWAPGYRQRSMAEDGVNHYIDTNFRATIPLGLDLLHGDELIRIHWLHVNDVVDPSSPGREHPDEHQAR